MESGKVIMERGKMKKRIVGLVLLILAACPAAFAGDEDSGWTFDVGANVTVGSGEHAPFWLTANRHGLASLERNSAYLRAAAVRSYQKEHGFDWECGADGAAGTLNVIQQLYAGIRYNCWQLTAGSREHASQGKNALLSLLTNLEKKWVSCTVTLKQPPVVVL